MKVQFLWSIYVSLCHAEPYVPPKDGKHFYVDLMSNNDTLIPIANVLVGDNSPK